MRGGAMLGAVANVAFGGLNEQRLSDAQTVLIEGTALVGVRWTLLNLTAAMAVEWAV